MGEHSAETIHLELLDDLDMPDAQRQEAAAWLREIEPTGFVRGILPSVWVETLRKVNGDADAQRLSALIEQLDGPFSVGRPMSQRDITLAAMAFWRMAWPELGVVEGCRRVVRESIQRIVTSPGFGMLLKVIDQGLADMAVMSEMIANMMTSFTSTLPIVNGDHFEMRLRKVSKAFIHLCVAGYFEGLLDMCQRAGEVTCARDGEEVVLVLDARGRR
jgi:hypothetical protein